MMQTPVRNIAVIDIGKTNAKVIVYDLLKACEVDARSHRNAVTGTAPYPHFETDELFGFVLSALCELHKLHGIDAISVTTHGATVALLNDRGGLALPVLDYEHTGPDETASAYDVIRPSFAMTGSPRLSAGLNIGAQLFWQKERFPEAFASIGCVLPYPQYWGYLLTGNRAGEVTSWGCHSDLWSPRQRSFSPLVEALGLSDKMPPLRGADQQLGSILPEIAAKSGLPAGCPVYTGIHDSNASLLPHLWSRRQPFSVVSTGTWVIAMSVGGRSPTLDERRDTLINVNAFGEPVPSARFMGGRVFEVAAPAEDVVATDDDRAALLRDSLMLMPSVIGDTGPFQGVIGGWTDDEETLTPGMRLVGVSWYLALMTAVCLDLTAASGPVIVEGPFAENADYLSMLSAAVGRPLFKSTGSGTSAGAAGLVIGDVAPRVQVSRSIDPPENFDTLATYAEAWRHKAERIETTMPDLS
ncbi:FGGY-family carbohydrate kinase [Martelella mediterranea]|nr:FGGY-family carbohydrate kinase [Martelella mediterranea]